MNTAKRLASLLILSYSLGSIANDAGDATGVQPISDAAVPDSSLDTAVIVAATEPPLIDYAASRVAFIEAEQRLATVSYEEVGALITPLQGYPLYPYLQFQSYQRFPAKLTQTQVNAFLDAYPSFPGRTRLQQTWLKQLAKEERWQDWLAAYQRLPISSDAYQCELARAYLNLGQQEHGTALAAKLWTVGKSRPDECNPLFDQWMKLGNPSKTVASDRYWLAAAEGEMRLARYLHRFMSDKANQLAARYESLMDHPEQVIQADLSAFPDAARQQLIRSAFQRLARQNPEATAERWIGWRQKLPENAPLRADLDVYIGKRLLGSEAETAPQWLMKIDPDVKHTNLTEARLLAALAAKETPWSQIQALIERLPESSRNSDRWRYWYARAIETLTPDNPAFAEIWNQLALSRSYYGFLAASRLHLPFQLNDAPMLVNRDLIATLQGHTGLQRAKEWLALERPLEATREWYSARSGFSPEQKQHLAALALEWGWYNQAILDAVDQKQWNWLDVRFPALYGSLFEREAGKNHIDVTWATSIARQESAFNPAAESRVGARGLMQLMPATAKATSKKHSLPLKNIDQLTDPATNIALGTAYLADMYNRFDRNRAYASAAYNAGPHRVERWLKERGHLPLDAWIETIPFAETRNYVQNVLAFRVVYGKRAGQDVAMLAPNERLLLAYQDKPVKPDTRKE